MEVKVEMEMEIFWKEDRMSGRGKKKQRDREIREGTAHSTGG